MTTSLTTLQPTGHSLPAAFAGQRAAPVFQGQQFESGAEGIEGSYGIIKYAGKVWALHIRGESKPFLRADDGTARGSIDVIFARTAPNKAKTYYEGFKEGSRDKPICWSNDGIRPDASVATKQAATCVACPRNVFGSRITDDGKQAKQCGDHKRAAVVLDPELARTVLGAPLSEPVLLRIPAASLNDFAVFSQSMEAQGFPLPSFIARITFDISKNYPKFKFEALRPLTDEEGKISLALREDPSATRIIADAGISEEPADVTAAGNAAPPPQAGIMPLGNGNAGGGQPTAQVSQPAQPQPQTTPAPVTQNVAPPLEGEIIPPATTTKSPSEQPAQTASNVEQFPVVARPVPETAAPTTDFENEIDAKINQLLG